MSLGEEFQIAALGFPAGVLRFPVTVFDERNVLRMCI
jgi:hypothetical protein